MGVLVAAAKIHGVRETARGLSLRQRLAKTPASTPYQNKPCLPPPATPPVPTPGPPLPSPHPLGPRSWSSPTPSPPRSLPMVPAPTLRPRSPRVSSHLCEFRSRLGDPVLRLWVMIRLIGAFLWSIFFCPSDLASS